MQVDLITCNAIVNPLIYREMNYKDEHKNT